MDDVDVSDGEAELIGGLQVTGQYYKFVAHVDQSRRSCVLIGRLS